MGNAVRLVVLVAWAIAITSCAGKKPPPFKPAYGPGDGYVMPAAVRVFVKRGISIETKDEVAGILVGSWESRGNRRGRWVVQIENEAFIVDFQCHWRPDGLKDWKPCPRDFGGPSEEAATIAREIEQQMGEDQTYTSEPLSGDPQ